MDQGIEKHQENHPPKKPKRASGRPGKSPVWASGAKATVGTAAAVQSRVWFTIGSGTLNEIYFPDVDQANTRSIRFLISDGESFFSDEQTDATHTVSLPWPGSPACRIETRCRQGRYTLVKEIVTDPVRDTLLMRVRFRGGDGGEAHGLRLYLYIDPHMGDRGKGNTAWIGSYMGQPMLVAQRGDACMSVTATAAMPHAGCGYVGRSDGLLALSRHKPLPDANLAENGNVALTAEVDPGPEGRFVVSIAFGSDPGEAGQQARAGVLEDFDVTRDLFVQQWVRKQSEYAGLKDLSGGPLDMYRIGTAVLEAHQSKRYAGAFVASLSLPWGFARSDEDLGGYHVTWPRDLVETAMGKLASGDAQSARSSLFYLACTQHEDGGWSQNMWLDGSMHWGAIQMDGIALPILLADQLRREGSLDGYNPAPMIRAAAGYLLRHGPVTQQDRWEAIPGYSPYTMATQVAALLAAAEFIESAGDGAAAEFLRRTADAWNDAIDEYTCVQGTLLARRHGVAGYYIRMAPPKRVERTGLGSLTVEMPNRPFGTRHRLASRILSPDALALVRFGLRAPDDPRILDTARMLDETLRRETATGPAWKRSTDDGYGEPASGKPFKKHGIGRGWPLLAGERAHYEIARGRPDVALELLKTISRQTSECGMIPEQVWDAPDIPERFLFNGHPAGSGMPLVWAHSEYIKLLRSLAAGSVWDMPPETVERYLRRRTASPFQIWTPSQRRAGIAPGKNLRIDLPGPARIAWSSRDGAQVEVSTEDSGFAWHTAMLQTAKLEPGETISAKISPLPGDGKQAAPATEFKVEVEEPDRSA